MLLGFIASTLKCLTLQYINDSTVYTSMPHCLDRLLIHWLNTSKAQRLNGSTAQRFNISTFHCLNGSTAHGLNSSMAKWLTGSTTNWLNGSRLIGSAPQWVNTSMIKCKCLNDSAPKFPKTPLLFNC
jgi:hypothetical protein